MDRKRALCPWLLLLFASAVGWAGELDKQQLSDLRKEVEAIRAAYYSFQEKNVKDWPSLWAALRQCAAADSKSAKRRLWERLQPAVQKRLEVGGEGLAIGEEDRRLVLSELTRISQQTDFYDSGVWPMAGMSSYSSRLLRAWKDSPAGQGAVALNLLLIEEMFPNGLSPVFADGIDRSDAFVIRRWCGRGHLASARGLADKYLVANPRSKYVRLESAVVWREMGEVEQAARDLDRLLADFPDFAPPYDERARLFVLQDARGQEHPVLDWLTSEDQRRSEAARRVLLDLILEKRQLLAPRQPGQP
jgi:hypothetical protein